MARRARGGVIPCTPQPLFDLAPFEVEHRPSIDRQRSVQDAMLAESEDTVIPRDARVFHLRRMIRFADTLIARLLAEEATP